jgi:hypothetical protein
MILCRECGNSAPSADGFCSSCGALLDWAGERVEQRQSPLTAPLVAPPVTPTAQRPVVTFNAQPLQQQTPFTPPAEQIDPAGRIPTPEGRRTDPVPLASEPEYTGPYCAACGTRNPEGRQFCRACGSLLRLDAQPAERRRRWWQRLFRRRSGYVAGERPGSFREHPDRHPAGVPHAPKRRRRLPRHIKLGKLAPVFIILGFLGIGLGPARAWVTDHVFHLFNRAKATLSVHYTNVIPVGATASGEKDHAAGLAVDGLADTYWASSQHPDGVGDTITVTFANPVDLDKIGLLSGADPADFRASARPHDLTVTVGGPGASGDATLTFDDTADFQSRSVSLHHVTSVTFTVKDSYPGQKKHDLAVREIQFYVLSTGQGPSQGPSQGS